MPVIYIDVLFGVNFLIDYMLFYVSAKIAGKRLHMFRMIAASFTGGLYSACVFFPRLGILQSVAIKILASAALVSLAFRLKDFKDFLYMLMVFYGVNFVFAGGISAVMYFTDFGTKTNALLSNGSLYIELSFFKLIIVATAIACALQTGVRILRNNLKKQGLMCEVVISEGNNKTVIYGILDTGNSLTSGNLPVMVVQFSAIAKLLNKEISKAIEIGDIAGAIAVADERWEKKLKIVSYSAIGTNSGIMLGFVPDKVTIEVFEKTYECDCVLAVYTGRLKYGAVINPDMLGGKDEYNGYCGIYSKKGKQNS